MESHPDRPGARSLQKLEGFLENAFLEMGIPGFSQRETQGEGKGQPSRGCHLLHDVFQVGETDGPDPLFLQGCGDQSHGLMACGSDWGQDHNIDTVIGHSLSHLRRRLPHEAKGSRDGSLKGCVTGSYLSDLAFSLESPESIQGKCHVGVGLDPCPVPGSRWMSANQVSQWRVSGNPTVGIVATL
jgi:hypothetical protein